MRDSRVCIMGLFHGEIIVYLLIPGKTREKKTKQVCPCYTFQFRTVLIDQHTQSIGSV